MYWYCSNGKLIKNTKRKDPIDEAYRKLRKISGGVKESKGLITQGNWSILIIAIKYLCKSSAKPKWVFIANHQPSRINTRERYPDHPVEVQSTRNPAPEDRSSECIDGEKKEKNIVTKRVTRGPQADRDELQAMIFMKIFLLNQM